MNASTSRKPSLAAVAQDDSKLANDAGTDRRATILAQIDTADDLMGTALLAGLQMTVKYGATSTAEVAKHYTRCNSAATYASWFNLGYRAQQVVGEKLALECIEKAAALKGSGFANARIALSKLLQGAKAEGLKELKPAAAKLAVKSAVTGVAESERGKDGAPKAKGPKRGTKTVDSATLAQAAMESGRTHRDMGAALRLMSQNAHRLSAPVGREEAHRAALKALADAAEVWGVFLK